MIKLFENFQTADEISKLCFSYDIDNYSINSNNTLRVYGDVYIYNRYLTKLPLNISEVSRSFCCSHNQLKTLEGCPQVIGGDFDCSHNKLDSLVGGPRNVMGNFSIFNNNIMTFHGFPEHIGGTFYYNLNPIYEVWKLFRNLEKIDLINEMNPLRVIDGKANVVIDILNDFLSIIGESEVEIVPGYINI